MERTKPARLLSGDPPNVAQNSFEDVQGRFRSPSSTMLNANPGRTANSWPIVAGSEFRWTIPFFEVSHSSSAGTVLRVLVPEDK